ncbi:hypothetical protein TEA_017683 [Camellia sinensis var. sinensis]|uniref:Uncharacterized protein n=1 Tax=Camellia sinensis var. sinensis TaxID=542762 RepID=A0A4S4DTG1_CAMSN|nr:hypothetical protein TEA_017683 [Camellia sinensis var. sinensis]
MLGLPINTHLSSLLKAHTEATLSSQQHQKHITLTQLLSLSLSLSFSYTHTKQREMAKDIEVGQHGGEFTSKDYQDPPPVPLIDSEELTKWSFYRAIIAEFIATLLFLYITVLTVIGYKTQTDPTKTTDQCGGVGILGIAWSFGGMIFVLVYCTAGISGGHINPAVTFGLFLARKVSLARAIMYMVAQCLGAICGCGLVKSFQKAYYVNYGGGANKLSVGYSTGTGLAAEIIGTFVLVYTVFSATDPKRNARDSHVPSKNGGICTMSGKVGEVTVIIQTTGEVPVFVRNLRGGGHINPAVTFGLFLARKVSLARAIMYMVAQCLGAICGCGLVKSFQKAYYVNYGGGANKLSVGYSTGTGLAAEIIGTFVLVYTVFSATDPKRNARDSHVPVLAPLPIGFAVFMVHLATIPITGTGINPARSFGAAVIYGKQKAWDDQWIFWVGPFIGAAIAAFYHQYILRAAAVKALGSFRSTT